MKIPDFESRELQPYVEFLLNQLRRTDGFWFLDVEKNHGYDSAIRANETVWQRMGTVMAREIREKFSIKEKGLKALVKVFRYHPWTIISGYDVQPGDGEVIVTVPHCPSQEARLKKGMGEYSCKEMHLGEFMTFIREVDEDLRVECLFAPPDPHPKEAFCKWRFTVAGESTR